MPDFVRQAPSVGDFNYKTDIALYREPASQPYSEVELEKIFSVKPRKYGDYRALAAYCLTANTGFFAPQLLAINVHDINRKESALYWGGRVYILRVWPCTLFSYIKERRYRPGVTALFTSAHGDGPISVRTIVRDLASLPITDVSIYRLRATYFQSYPQYT